MIKTDYQKVTEKLEAIGARLHDFATNETDETEADVQIDFWDVNGKGLIVLGYLDGRCGLYTLVGENGEPVEEDLEFIEKFAGRPVDVVLYCPNCGQQHIDEAKPDVCELCGHDKERHFSANVNISPTSVDVCSCCDHGEFKAWLNPPHKSHRCHSCNHVWRPVEYPTNGVRTK